MRAGGNTVTMVIDAEILEKHIALLEERVRQLERKVEFLRLHPTIARG